MYVRPHLRGQGLGSALLGEAVRLTRGRGAQEMHINVDEVDLGARRFYERHGFTNTEAGQEYQMLCYIREL